MSEVLYNEDDTQVIQLSGNYNPCWSDSIEELKAIFFPGNVELHRFKSGGKSKVFHITAEEADTLTEAWISFRITQAAKEREEQERVASVVGEAMSLLEPYPTLTVTEHPETEEQIRYWRIVSDVPDIRHVATSPDSLLSGAKEAIATYQRYQEANKIAESCSALSIRAYGNHWHVKITDSKFAALFANSWTAGSPEELLAAVNHAKAVYEEWQAEQDKPATGEENFRSNSTLPSESNSDLFKRGAWIARAMSTEEADRTHADWRTQTWDGTEQEEREDDKTQTL